MKKILIIQNQKDFDFLQNTFFHAWKREYLQDLKRNPYNF